MNTALLLIDIQNDYFENGRFTLFEAENASYNAKKILELFRAEKSLIVHVQHISTRANSTFFLPNTIGCEIHENVKPLPSEKIIIKHEPNSFQNTELLEYLRQKEISNLVICGMMTHLCVDATTRAAKDLGFKCTLIADACATKDLEIFGQKIKANDVHNSFLAALNYFYSTVQTTEDFLKIYSKH